MSALELAARAAAAVPGRRPRVCEARIELVSVVEHHVGGGACARRRSRPAPGACSRRAPRSRPSAATRRSGSSTGPRPPSRPGSSRACSSAGAEAQRSAKLHGAQTAPRGHTGRRATAGAGVGIPAPTRWWVTTAPGWAAPSSASGSSPPSTCTPCSRASSHDAPGTPPPSTGRPWARSWHRFTEVAAKHPMAWFPEVRSADRAGRRDPRQPPGGRALSQAHVRLLPRGPGRGGARDVAGSGARRRRGRAAPCSAGRGPRPPTSGSPWPVPTSVRSPGLATARLPPPPPRSSAWTTSAPSTCTRASRVPSRWRSRRSGSRGRRQPGPDGHRWTSLFRRSRQQLLPARHRHHGRPPARAGRDRTGERARLVRHQARRGHLRRRSPRPRLAPWRHRGGPTGHRRVGAAGGDRGTRAAPWWWRRPWWSAPDGAVSAAPVIARLADGRQIAAAAAPGELAALAGRNLVGERVDVSGDAAPLPDRRLSTTDRPPSRRLRWRLPGGGAEPVRPDSDRPEGRSTDARSRTRAPRTRRDPHHQPARGTQRHQRRRQRGDGGRARRARGRRRVRGRRRHRRGRQGLLGRHGPQGLRLGRGGVHHGRAREDSPASPSGSSRSRSSPPSTAPRSRAAARSCSRATSWWPPTTPPSASPRPSGGWWPARGAHPPPQATPHRHRPRARAHR